MKPYTYLIGWSKQNLWYYGSRYAKKCDPSDLWVKYFTSSHEVKKLREAIGEPDVIQVRRTFETVDQALQWEQKVISRMNMMKKSEWLNLGNAGREFKITTEHLEIKSKKYTGAGNPNFGKTHTPEARKRISEARKRKGGTHFQPHSDDVKRAARERTLEQMRNGTHSSQIRVCCIHCKKEVTPTMLTRFHKHQ